MTRVQRASPAKIVAQKVVAQSSTVAATEIQTSCLFVPVILGFESPLLYEKNVQTLQSLHQCLGAEDMQDGSAEYFLVLQQLQVTFQVLSDLSLDYFSEWPILRTKGEMCP